MSKSIPISAAREFAKNYEKDQVIVLSFSRSDGKTWVTTYGKTAEDCEQAALGGNKLKQVALARAGVDDAVATRRRHGGEAAEDERPDLVLRLEESSDGLRGYTTQEGTLLHCGQRGFN